MENLESTEQMYLWEKVSAGSWGEKEKGEEEEVILGMKAKILDHHSALHSVDTDNPLKEPVAQRCSKATEISNYARNTHSLKIPERPRQ